jgi:hypothetical protein
MSFSRVAVFGLFPLLAAAAAACGSSTVSDTGGTTAGMGGSSTSSTTGTGASTTTTTATSTSSSSGDGAGGKPSTDYPAPFPAPPQVQDFGGPVLASPKIVPVFFSSDDQTFVAQVVDFDTKVGQSAYWTAAVSEYGVGPATATPTVLLTEAAPGATTDPDIQTWLAGKLDSMDPAWPAPDGNTVYVLHYPAGTTISYDDGMGGTATSCQYFGGYHDNITLQNGTNVAYAVIPRCQGFQGSTDLQTLTGTESHELVEASTDPYPSSEPAYADIDDGHIYWDEALGGGEVGDMCAQFDGVFIQPTGLDYVVQRIWSNKAALAGNDPCVPPVAGQPYFNAAPELPDETVSIMGQDVTIKAVQIPVGQTKTVMLDLFSNASTNGPFSVHVDDGNYLMGESPLLSFGVAPGTPTIPCPTGAPTGSVCVGGENGQKIPITIKVMTAGQGNAELFWVISEQDGDPNENFWIGLVTN